MPSNAFENILLQLFASLNIKNLYNKSAIDCFSILHFNLLCNSLQNCGCKLLLIEIAYIPPSLTKKYFYLIVTAFAKCQLQFSNQNKMSSAL